MNNPVGHLTRLITRDQRGAALVEMGLLLILIVIAALLAVSFAGDSNSELWSQIGDGFSENT